MNCQGIYPKYFNRFTVLFLVFVCPIAAGQQLRKAPYWSSIRDSIVKSNGSHEGMIDIRIANTQFTSPVIFNYYDFSNSKIVLSSSIFPDFVYFNNIRIDSLEVTNSEFLQNFQFFMSKFAGTTRIANSNFHGFFEIYGSTIDKKISIIDSKFGNIFELDNLNIIEPPLFYNSELPDTLNLFSLKLDSLKRELDFSDCVLGKRAIENGRKCLVQIYDTDMSKLILPSHLFTIDNRNDERLTSSAKLDRLSQTYERLIRKSKDLGMMNSAEGWDIEYQRRLNDQKVLLGIKTGTAINLFHRLWWNFGYSKWKILWIWLPFFYFLFSVINYFIFDKLHSTIYNEQEIGTRFGHSYSPTLNRRNKFLYSCFYTAKIYFGFKLSFEAINYQKFLGFAYVFLIYITGLIHVTFAVAGYLLKV